MDMTNEGNAIKSLTDKDLVSTAFGYRAVFLTRQKQYHRALEVYSKLIQEMEARGVMDEFREKIR